MQTYAITVTSGNDINIIEFDKSKSYDTIKQAIGGGTFDCVRLPSINAEMWIDDEGKLINDIQWNHFGTALWVNEYGMTDAIAGDIIITGGVDINGNTLGLDEEDIPTILVALDSGLQTMNEYRKGNNA